MDIKKILIKLRSESIITALSVSSFLSCTICLFGPATLYFTNIFEFDYTFFDIIPFISIIALILSILLLFIILLFKKSHHQKIVCFVFALGLLFYIQGNILLWNYGLLDGREIIWDNYLINGIIDSLIWIVILGISFFKSEKIYKFVPLICLFFIVIQFGGLLSLIYFAPSEPQWKSYSFADDETKFCFSEKSNVIIIVLDTFQSDVFQEIIDENDVYKYMFQGFTYYRNTAGGYPTTIASVPLMLTGQYYNNSEPFNRFIQSSYETSSLPKILKEKGYVVDIYASPRLVYPDDKLESNVQRNLFNNEVILSSINQLYQLTVFRHSPQLLKEELYPLIFREIAEVENIPDKSFYDDVKNQTYCFSSTPVFKFYYLDGAHPPFRLNDQVEFEQLPDNRSGYKEQSKASLRITAALIEKLKKSGSYDNSMIIIVGDHGMRWNGYGLNISGRPEPDQISYTSQNIITAGLPLMLVKPFNSNGSLSISDAPVSLSDIPKTVTTELNIPNQFPGISVLDVDISDKRKFTFYHYTWADENWFDVYLPPLYEYKIDNFSWHKSSWRSTYKVYTSQGIETIAPPDYILGTTIKFGSEKQPSDYLISGWSAPEKSYVWSEGKTATIAFSMNSSNSKDMNLHIIASPFLVENRHEQQRVQVYLNQHAIGNIVMTPNQKPNMDFIIPADYLNDRMQYISFIFPDAISPSELGISDDPRNLAIALTSFTITEIYNGKVIYSDGWYSAEAWSGNQTRWMSGDSVLHIYSDDPRAVTLAMQSTSFGHPRILEIAIQNHSIGQVTVPTEIITITVPLTLNDGDNAIAFHSKDSCDRPSDVPGLNSIDSRCLSIAVQNITF